jgi:hypothetical protein
LTFLLAGFGNVMFFCSCIFFLCPNHVDADILELFAGFGCFSLWISLTGYLENTRYNVAWVTIAKAGPIVLRVIIGVLPFFIGFMMCGVLWFNY